MVDPEIVVLQVASTEPDSKMIEGLVVDVLLMTHGEESMARIRKDDQAFGWNFYVLSINKQIARRLAELPGSGILDMKGNSLEQKFVSWLNGRATKNGIADKTRFNLLSDLKSSRYGLF